MAFEKAKVIKAAEKFLSQGKINAAIKEYRQIIAHDGDDLTTLNMLGDLLARAGEKEEAASCFLRIAEHYREQEFRLKAIAMYRKIEKLKPRDPATARELAALYSAQGLIADARAQYLVVADAHTRAGESKQTLEVLHKIADLDPNNTEIRLKLAAGYLKEGMEAEAAKAYSEAANRLLESSRFEASLDAYSQALELRPHDRTALKGLVSAHAALGSADDAAELLEKAVADVPDDLELISMLARAYMDAEDAAGAERATAMLMAQDASNYRRYIEVAQVYLKVGQEAEAARIVGTIIEPMLAGREESDLLELVNELLARDPEHVACLRLLARIHWWQRDMEKLRAALERLAEAAEAAGLVEDERYALTQLVRLVPDAQGYLDRLNLIGGFLEDSGDGTSMSDDPSLTTVPSYEGFAIVGEPDPDLPAGQTSEFEWNSVAEEPPSHAGVSFADLNETEDQSKVTVLPDPVSADPLTQSADFAEGLVQTATDHLAGEAQGSPADIKVMMRQELESVDFYIAQGYSDIAFDTLELLERQFGSHPEIESRRETLKTGKEDSKAEPLKSGPQAVGSGSTLTAETDSPAIDLSFGDIEIGQTPTVATPAPVGSGLDSGLAEIFEEFRLEAEGESASSNEDFETHYNMATAYKEMDLLDEAIREFQIAAGLTGSVEAAPRFFQCCNMLGHCFVEKEMPRAAVLWFKKGLDAPGRSPEEYKALQYELGSAYEAMGDLTRAVAAFTEVYGVDVGYRDIAEKLESLQARAAAQKHKKKGK
jgi:tetratricopeptide (TPR) repeat protein